MCNSVVLRIVSIFFFALLRSLLYWLRRAVAKLVESDFITHLSIQFMICFIIIRQRVVVFFDDLMFIVQQITLALFDGLVLAVEYVIARVALIWEEIELIELFYKFWLLCDDPIRVFFAMCVISLIGVFYTYLFFLTATPVYFFHCFVKMFDLEDFELQVQISFFILGLIAISALVVAVLI